MENNMNTEQTTQTENMGNETEVQETPAEGKEKSQRLFTQEEVNGFVQSRIARIKGQINKEARAEFNQRMSELEARERKLMVKEHLSSRGMPKELADIITCTDEDDLISKLDALQSIYGDKAKEQAPKSAFRFGVSAQDGQNNGIDPVRQAMGLDRKE